MNMMDTVNVAHYFHLYSFQAMNQVCIAKRKTIHAKTNQFNILALILASI